MRMQRMCPKCGATIGFFTESTLGRTEKIWSCSCGFFYRENQTSSAASPESMPLMDTTKESVFDFPFSVIDTDAISRSYLLKQLDMAIAEARTVSECEQFKRFKSFILALPCLHELEEKVRCVDCVNFVIGNGVCKYRDVCYSETPDKPVANQLREYFCPVPQKE